MRLHRFVAAAAVVCAIVISRPVRPAAQDQDDFGQQPQQIIETEVTTSTGSKGVMVRPFGTGRHPAVLHLHGFGETVAKSMVLLRLFARAGYVAMDIEYPAATGDAGADVQDAMVSLEYLKSNRYVDRRLVGVNGFSRGARAALRLAMSQEVRAVSAIAARSTGGSAPTILDDADKLKAPVLLQHGTEDPGVPYQDSVLLEQKLKSLKKKVTLVTWKGYDHNGLPWDRVYERVLLFFNDNLR